MSRGLSSANFVTGAMDGYRFMSGVENDKLRKEEIQANRGLRDAESARREEDHAMRKTEHEATKQIQGIRMDQLNDEKIAQMNKAAAWSLYNAKDMPEEYQSLVAAHPNLDFNRLTSEEAGKHEKTIDALMNGDIEMTDPAVAEAMDFLNPEIGLGSSGGRKVKTSRLFPGKNPGTVMVGLSVEGDDRIRPLTERRSADDDDPVREIPVEMLLERAQIFKDTRRMLSDPKGRDWFIKTNLPELDGKKASQWSDPITDKESGMVYQKDLQTGEIKQLDPRKSGAAGAAGSGGKQSAFQQEINTLREMFPEASNEELLNLKKLSASDPTGEALRLLPVVMENMRSASTDEDGNALPMGPAEAMEHAVQIVKSAQSKFRPTQQKKGSGSQGSSHLAAQINQISGGQQQSGVPIPMKPQQRQAPPSAIEFLKANPNQAENFKAKYGYLPE